MIVSDVNTAINSLSYGKTHFYFCKLILPYVFLNSLQNVEFYILRIYLFHVYLKMHYQRITPFLNLHTILKIQFLKEFFHLINLVEFQEFSSTH